MNWNVFVKSVRGTVVVTSMALFIIGGSQIFSQLLAYTGVTQEVVLCKLDRVSFNVYRQWILTFRLKYVFVAGKIVRTARQTIVKISEGYLYKEVFQ